MIISGAYVVFSTDETQLHPKYLFALVKTKRFLDYVNENASGGVRMNFTFDHMADWKIPMPPIEKQLEIIQQIEKQQAIIEGVEKILQNWDVEIDESTDKRILSDFITDSLYGISSKLKSNGKFPVLRMNNLDTKSNWYLTDLKYIDNIIPKKRNLDRGDFIFNRTNSIELVGKSGVIDFDFSGTFAGYLIRLRFNDELNPYYLRYLFSTERYRKYFSSIAKPAGGQANINADELAKTKIDYFDLKTQEKIVNKFDAEMELLKRLSVCS